MTCTILSMLLRKQSSLEKNILFDKHDWIALDDSAQSRQLNTAANKQENIVRVCLYF